MQVILQVFRQGDLSCTSISTFGLSLLQLFGGNLPSLDRLLTEAHKLLQARVLLLESFLDLTELFLISKSLLS